MGTAITVIIIILVIVVILALIGMGSDNGGVKSRTLSQDSWRQIDGELNRKFIGGVATGPGVAVIDTGSGPNAELNVRGGTNCSNGKS